MSFISSIRCFVYTPYPHLIVANENFFGVTTVKLLQMMYKNGIVIANDVVDKKEEAQI